MPCMWWRRARSSRAGPTPSYPPIRPSCRPTWEACNAMAMTDIVGIAVSTIILGSIYGLVAIGMSLIYGILRVLDMSQGSMVMVGSFVAWAVLVLAQVNPLIALAAAFGVTFILGVLTQLVSVQPLVGRASIDFEMV